jgi:uncharacterized protein YndB with AHSA1/START domain
MTETKDALSIARTIAAPRERVWHAWTDPAQLARWWWPERFQTSYQIDLRVGGAYRIESVELPNHGILRITGRFLVIQPPEHLVYTWQWGFGEEPESIVSVEFVETDGHTEVRISHEQLSADEAALNYTTGWNDCLDRLEEMFTA